MKGKGVSQSSIQGMSKVNKQGRLQGMSKVNKQESGGKGKGKREGQKMWLRS